MKIEIIYEDNHLLVVNKPINIPVQADDSNDLDLLTMLKEYLKETYNKPGNVYLGLVHRLDRPVGGLMVFAKTSKAARRLSEQIKNHNFKKEYLAIIQGKLEPKTGTLKDHLLKNHQTNMVMVNKNGKEAVLDYQVIEEINDYSLIKINLKTGRSHQIRVQFASRNYPLYGDQRYNANANTGEQIALFASKLNFDHPVKNSEMWFTLPLPTSYPWSAFHTDSI